jgi:hypothetical protein
MSSEMIEITPLEASKCIDMCWKAGLVPMLHGSPGIGKSHIVLDLAKKYKLKVIDIRLSQCDPVDLNGFPMLIENKGSYVPMDIFPLEDDIIPKEYNGWVVFLDEINSAAAATQAAAYKLVLDRKIGQKNLHKRVVLVAAGNLMTDMAIVNRLSTAMQSRMVNFILRVDHKSWDIWAAQNRIYERVIGFINANEKMLHSFDPTHNDKTFPCPRTWEFASRILQLNPSDELKLPLLAGAVGKGAAIGYTVYEEVYADLPSLTNILQAPKTIEIPKDPAAAAAQAAMVANNMTLNNASKLMDWVLRLRIEFQTWCMRDAVNKTPALFQTPEVDAWATANAKVLA